MVKKVKSSLKNAIATDVFIERKPTKEQIEKEKKWQAEDDIRTLQRAEEIKKDKGRMNAAKQVAKSQMQELKKIC